DASVLSEFRQRLITGSAETLLFTTLLDIIREHGLIKARGKQRTDSTHVLAAIRVLNRLMCVGEALRQALNALATLVPDWLFAHSDPDWFDRYRQRLEEFRLPTSKSDRIALANLIGVDGRRLLEAVYAPSAPTSLRELPAVTTLRQIWIQQYYAVEHSEAVRWRDDADLPPGAQLIVSPYDSEARWSEKRSMTWVGYKVHVTESCDDDGPPLITNVETTPATQPDAQALAPIHAALADHNLLPAEHMLDAGYVDGTRLLESRSLEVTLLGPVPRDGSWQARTEGAFDTTYFAIDWEQKQVRCPQGHSSREWKAARDRHGKATIHVAFAQATCRDCPIRAQCTQAKMMGRELTLRHQEHHEAIQAARIRQKTTDFKHAYARRSGVEGVLSQGVRVCNLRRSRYIGMTKTRLQHLIIATAINLIRLVAWLLELPRSSTRQSAFAALGAGQGLKFGWSGAG
ncbi:MAG: IS1182 family transposase, partial [Roseiflexaceae bacterium]|nr:IS1182 family transposase [Roseiflexaceae bacterium]